MLQDTRETRVLVAGAARGEQDAVATLLERYMPGLRAYVRLRADEALRARESCSDLVQSACREVLANLEKFRYADEAGFKQWLYATAMRKILHRHEYHRAAKRDVLRDIPLAVSGAGGDARLLDCYRSFSSPSQHAVAREELARVEGAFAKLGDEQREVILQAKLMGLSRAEIAANLGKTEVAVRVLLHRALARLAQELEPGG